MPRQPALPNRPYTKPPSALRKTELVRLCTEFGLPSDGSVVSLRDRAKDFLTTNRDNLVQNPRYKALFPRQRRRNQISPTPPTSSHTLSSQHSSRASSPAYSDGSWAGIDNLPPILHQQPPNLIYPQPLSLPIDSRPSTPVPNPGLVPPSLGIQADDTHKFPRLTFPKTSRVVFKALSFGNL